MPLKLNSTGGGSVTLDVPSTASDLTLTAPAVNGSLVTTGDSGTVTNTMLATPNPLTLMTAQASTSGTSIPFTGIPSWVNRITIMFSGVSTSGSSVIILQLGTSSGFETSGYTSTGWDGTNVSATTGIALSGTVASGNIRSGNFMLTRINGNTWVGGGVIIRTDSATGNFSAGTKALGGTLTQVRVTTVNGTDTFDAGTIGVMYD